MAGERDRFSLLAELIRERQPTVDEAMVNRAAQWILIQQSERDKRAAAWRKARARLCTHGDYVRPVVRALWREAPYPADPSYLLDMLHRIDIGRIDIEKPRGASALRRSPRVGARSSVSCKLTWDPIGDGLPLQHQLVYR